MITTAPIIEKSEILSRVAVIDTLPIKRGLLFNPCLAGVTGSDVREAEFGDPELSFGRPQSDDTRV